MKQVIYNDSGVYIRLHKSKEGPKETFVVHLDNTARIFPAPAGLINYLNGKIEESQLVDIEDWLNNLEPTTAA